MNTLKHIKRFDLHATRLLLVLIACDGGEHISELPRIMKQAGLTPGQYAQAFQLLKDWGFLDYQDGSICILFPER